MKISRFASIASVLLFLASVPCFAADGDAPDAPPAPPVVESVPGERRVVLPPPTPAGAAPATSSAPALASGRRGGFQGGNVRETVSLQVIEENIPDPSNNGFNGGGGSAYSSGVTLGVTYEPGMTLTQLFNIRHSVRPDAITQVWLGHSDTSSRGGRRGAAVAASAMTLVDYAAIKAGQAQDIVLSPNDLVRVQESFVEFHVQTGRTDVKDEKIPYKEGMTVMQLIKTEGKDIKWMDLGNVTMGHIYGNHSPDVHDPIVKVDYAAIASGQAKDIPLAAGGWVKVGIKPFVFQGGTPGQVIKAIEDFFGADMSMASIPPEMADVQVPMFQITEPTEAHEVLRLYNNMGQKIPALGQWFWGEFDTKEGQPENFGPGNTPGLLMLIPDKSVAQAYADKRTVKARAISIANIPASEWHKLQFDIIQADAFAQKYIKEIGGAAVDHGGTVQLQDDSKILIAIGIPSFIELSESVVAAYEKNKSPNPSPPAK